MSVSASHDNRRMSVTREIYRKLSRGSKDAGDIETHFKPTRRRRHGSGPTSHTLKRVYYTVPEANKKYMPIPKAFRKGQTRTERKTRLQKIRSAIWNRLPIIEFVKNYNIKESLVADLVAGVAVTGLHFPQGLAYGILAGLTPAIGMVSTIFPVFIYMIFGSSAHTSIGTNAIVSIMIGDMFLDSSIKAALEAVGGKPVDTVVDIVTNLTNISDSAYSVPIADASSISPDVMSLKISLTAGVTFFTGVIFIVMAIFRMGFTVTYLSQSFMSGFTTGVAVHIFSSQVKTALGVKIPPVEGIGKLIKMYYHVFANIPSANVADIVVTIICCIILVIVKVGVNERLKPKVPVPIDFLLLVFATIVSHFAKLPENYNVRSLGKIEVGIPPPTLPTFQPVAPLFMCAVQVALVTFFLNIAVTQIIARRNGYEVSNNVELHAYGMCNLFSGFFLNIPASIAPPRSTLLSSMGAKTTLNAVSTLSIMLALIFYLGQFFESCPRAVLASMIMVAMKDLLKQVTCLPKLWKLNKNDFVTWLSAAVICVLGDIAYGLVFGVLISLISVINQSQRGWVSVVGKSSTEDLYLDKDDYGAIHDIHGIKIVRMESSLYFATAEKFRKSIYKIIEMDADELSRVKKESKSNEKTDKEKNGLLEKENDGDGNEMQTTHNVFTETIAEEDEEENSEDKPVNNNKASPSDDEDDNEADVKVLIIDCIPINFIDGTGLDMLKLVVFELGLINITVYLARCSRYMLRLLEKSDIYDYFPRENVFVDLPDAVHAAHNELSSPDKDTVLDKMEKMEEALPEQHPTKHHHSQHPQHRSRFLSLTPMRRENSHDSIDRFMQRHGSIYQPIL